MENGHQNFRKDSPEKRKQGIIADDRAMPHDLDVEKAVLAAMLMDPKPCIDLAVERFGLTPVFYHQAHAKIYNCIYELYKTDPDNIDVITVSSQLAREGVLESIGGEVYLTDIQNSIATTANFEAWCKIVDDYSMLRRMIKSCHESLDKCYNATDDVSDIINEVEGTILKVREDKVESSIFQMKDLAQPAFRMINDLYHQRIEPGIQTKFPDLDKKINGLKQGEMFVLAARPSIGKTSLALNMISNIAMGSNPRPVAFFSLEMPELQIAVRLLCSHANISIKDIYDKSVKPKDLGRFTKAANDFMNAQIFIDPTPSLKISELRAKARRMKSQHDIQVIAIDYLQLMHPDKASDSRQQDVSSISHAIKALAKELEVPILVLAQLNREIEKAGKGTPKLSHLRESGAIEQDADVVAFLHRDREQQKEASREAQINGIDAQLIIEKNRNGETGIIDLLFFPKRMLFACKEHRYGNDDLPDDGEN